MLNVKRGLFQVAMLVRGIIAGLAIGILLFLSNQPGFSTEEGKDLSGGHDERDVHDARVDYDTWISTRSQLAEAGWSKDGMFYDPPQD